MIPISQQGFYPDPISRRMAVDGDGTVGILIRNGVITQLSSSVMTGLNSESFGNRIQTDGWLHAPIGDVGYIFPEKRNIHGFFITGSYPSTRSSNFYVSSDTTTGVDGNWRLVVSGDLNPINGGTTPYYRTNIQLINEPDIKGVKFYGGKADLNTVAYISNFHIYGMKSAGETPHRIDFCDFDGSELIRDNDYGDQPRNSTRIWQPSDTWNQGSGLYLRNKSLEKVANDVVVATQSLTGDMNQRVTVSKDGATYGTQTSYAQIQPQQIVGPLYVKHTSTPTTALGVAAGRLKLTVGAWI